MSGFVLSLLCVLILTHTTYGKKLGAPYSAAELKESRDVALHWHNLLRTWHSAPKMVLNDDLNKEAQKAAEHLVGLGKMEHTSAGENLYWAGHSGKERFNAKKEAEKAVKAWYFELCDTKNWPTGELNHFTQVVWKDSVQLGIGVATDEGNSEVYIVGRYKPFGNYQGEYRKGVGKLICNRKQICNGMKAKPVSSVDDCKGGAGHHGAKDNVERDTEEGQKKKSGAGRISYFDIVSITLIITLSNILFM